MTTIDVLSCANDLLSAHNALLNRVRTSQRHHRRQAASLPSPPKTLIKLPLIPSPSPSPDHSPPSTPLLQPKKRGIKPDLPPAKRARAIRYQNYIPEEETIRNDYSQRYVDGGDWPQNWVLGADPDHRFEEYPKQQRLLSLKKLSVDAHATPPTYLPMAQLSTLHPAKFDVILIDPPFSSSFTWNDLQDLPIPSLAADPSFVLLWVGSGAGDGLERGREILARWGFRRCEDIVWVKTNQNSNAGPGTDPPTTSLLTRTKQHCLMGIRGTVRRSTDSWFVHCNVDTDVMLWEGDPDDPTLKPPEMYTLVENFCLGLRRLELFARGKTLRRGWVSVLSTGEEERIPSLEDEMTGADDRTPARWDKDKWDADIKEIAQGGRFVVPMTSDIEALRPKSPVRGGSSNTQGNQLPKPPQQHNQQQHNQQQQQHHHHQQMQQQQQQQQQQHMNNMNLMNMGMNMGMQQPQFQTPHPMMVPQMMAMDQMGMMAHGGWPGMNVGMMPPQGFPRPGPPFMQMGMGMMPGPAWLDNGGFAPPTPDGAVWNPAMMGMPPNMGGMDMGHGHGQWGPFGFQ